MGPDAEPFHPIQSQVHDRQRNESLGPSGAGLLQRRRGGHAPELVLHDLPSSRSANALPLSSFVSPQHSSQKPDMAASNGCRG